MSYKLGSLFDGSGGFPLSGFLCGIEPVWAAEVEPYPIAVTRSRFPKMKHLGDISKVSGSEIEPVDIVTFGSPCQDLSVAGKRAGLKHTVNGDEETTRSGLFMEAVRIVKEMRLATDGVYPRFALWENVPGAFSSNKGEDFRIVLEELIKIKEPDAVMPPVPQNGWAYADSYIGDGWSIAYRVFDAQYWGVPQRRRRIHLVADFRGECAGEILFKREGLRGYFTEGRTPWQAIAGDAENSTGAADTEGFGVDTFNLALTGDVAITITAGASDANHVGAVCVPEKTIFALDRASFNQGKNAKYDFEITDSGIASPLVAMGPSAVSHAVYWNGDDVAGTLTANNAGGNQRMPDKDNFNCVLDPSNGVACTDVGWLESQENCSPTLLARMYKDPHLVGYQAGVMYIVRRLTPTERARLQGFADRWGHFEEKDSLTSEEYEFWLNVRNTHAAINGKAVCDYTEKQMLTWYNKLRTDAAEYKMWGNGIALPPALYCMQGIVDALESADDFLEDWM